MWNKPKKVSLFKLVKLNESSLDAEVSAILNAGTFIGACIETIENKTLVFSGMLVVIMML
jgi:hypothetical protein